MIKQTNNLVTKPDFRRQRVSIGQLLVMIGLFLTAFSLPLLDWRFFIQGLEFNISDFLILSTAVIYFIDRLLSYLRGQSIKAWRWPLGWPIAIFLIIILLSSAFSPWPLPALKYSLRVIVFAYIFYLALPFNALDSWQKWRWPLAGVIIAGGYRTKFVDSRRCRISPAFSIIRVSGSAAKPSQSTSTEGTVTRNLGTGPGPPGPGRAMRPSTMTYSWLEKASERW